MTIPSVPTDNLYKFLAVFGLILIVYSSYMYDQSNSDIFTKLDKLEAKESINKLKVEKDSTSITVQMDKINFNAEYKGVSRQADRFIKLYTLYVILFFLGSGLSGVGFYCWYYRVQILNDDILKDERDKIINVKLIEVHKVQFEKEFEVYKALWPVLIKLRNATHSLRPIFEVYKSGETEEEKRNKKWEEFIKPFNECLEMFEQNKPFYPEDIFKIIEKVVQTSRKESSQFMHMPKSEEDYYNNAEKHMDLIISRIDTICTLIRKRIGVIKVEE